MADCIKKSFLGRPNNLTVTLTDRLADLGFVQGTKVDVRAPNTTRKRRSLRPLDPTAGPRRQRPSRPVPAAPEPQPSAISPRHPVGGTSAELQHHHLPVAASARNWSSRTWEGAEGPGGSPWTRPRRTARRASPTSRRRRASPSQFPSRPAEGGGRHDVCRVTGGRFRRVDRYRALMGPVHLSPELAGRRSFVLESGD